MRTPDWSPTDVDAILDAFEEEQQRRGDVDLADFLPDSSATGYLGVAVELIRVDLECSRARGVDRRLEDYRDLAPRVFDNSHALSQVAYEEYRLRRQSGEQVDVAEYSRRFSLDTSGWPVWSRDATNSISRRSAGSWAGDAAAVGTRFPSAGERFAGFDLAELLGRGAFGVVFRARQHDLARREVVLKITAPRSVEPQRLARLQHTNIVPIYSVHQDAGLLGICMPYLGRHTLADVLRGDRPEMADQARLSTVAEQAAETVRSVPAMVAPSTVDDGAAAATRATSIATASLGIEAATEVIAQLAEGLAHAHSRGIVHSDLKPANVLVADDGTPLLVDFNLAGDTAATNRETLLVGGTLAYMAPEHLSATLDGSQTLAESDIYSLGVIFFELLTRRRPFSQRDGSFEERAAEMIRDRKRGAPTVRSLNAGVSPALASIVARCLAPNLADRYRHAGELAEDLRRQQANLPLRFTAEPSLRERGRKWLRRNARGLRVAAMAALVVTLAATAALYMQRRDRLLNLETDAAYAGFQGDFVAASLSLNTPGNEPELFRLGREAANRALGRFGIGDDRSDARNAYWQRLSAAQRAAVDERTIKLKYALANSAEEKQRLFARYDASSELGTYLYGIELLTKRESRAAVKVFERLRQRDPQDATLWLLLGNAYYRVHRMADAEACYTAVIALEPRAYTGYYYRGECRMDQGHFADAEQDFNAVLELRPGLPVGLLNRALIWRALGAYERAERDATAAIDGGTNDPRAFFVRALIREARGNLAGAHADRERGFELRPVDGQGWVARGIARLKDDPQQARDDFEQGLQVYPDSPALVQNLVHLYGDQLHQPELALAMADRLVELCPGEPSALASRAVLRARSGDRDAARQDAAQAAAGEVAPVTALQLACVYALTAKAEPKDADDAIHQLQQALARDPRLAARATTDPDLASIRSRPEFAALLTAASQLTNPVKPPATEAAAATDSSSSSSRGQH